MKEVSRLFCQLQGEGSEGGVLSVGYRERRVKEVSFLSGTGRRYCHIKSNRLV